MLVYKKEACNETGYKISFNEDELTLNILQKKRTRDLSKKNKATEDNSDWPIPRTVTPVSLSKEKIKDIKSMLKCMPTIDKNAMQHLCL